MNAFPILSTLILLPLLGAVVVAMTASAKPTLGRLVALGFACGTLALTLLLAVAFDTASGSLQFIERSEWIPALGVEWFLGLDGLSLLLALLAAIVTPFALLMPTQQAEKANLYYALMLLLQAAVMGVFLCLNFVPWFLFWELSIIPAFFLIKLWGGAKSAAAADQFFLYTMTGSIAMLIGFLALYIGTGTFDFIALAELFRSGELASAVGDNFPSGPPAATLLLLVFGGIFLGLAVKVPIIPFHTWLPNTYAEAPTGVTILLTGLLSKMGIYGFLRILLPVFPEQIQELQVPFLILAIGTIVLSAFSALAQTDLKRILAYSSINHLGYCLLGIFALTGAVEPGLRSDVAREGALSGVFLQLFNHGLTASALFAFVALIESRSGSLRGLHDFGGLRKVAPVLCGFMGIALFASLGLPGLNGFIGEFLIFKGSFALAGWATVLALPGLLVTAVFLLRIMARVFSGPLNPRWEAFPDLSLRERLTVGPAIALMLLVGVYPAPLLDLFNTTVTTTLSFLP